MVQRVTYRRRHCYATKSNRMRRLRTPGGKIVVQRVQKRASVPTCGEAKCSLTLPGIPALRPTAMSQKRLPRKNKTVNRKYGGHLCSGCVRTRVMRAFLVEEQKIVKKVLKMQKEAPAAPAKKSKK